MLTYLIYCLCKLDHTMSELMENASKESSGRNVWGKLSGIRNAFITKREVLTHEAIKRVLSLPLRTSNIVVTYISNAQKNRTRMLKSSQVLETMESDDNNVYMSNIVNKNEDCPYNLEQVCLVNFATMYDDEWKSEDEQERTEGIKSDARSASYVDENNDEKRNQKWIR